MSNQEQLEHLIRCRHPCVSIVTLEEAYALGLVRNAAILFQRPLMVWSLDRGLHDGLFEKGPVIADSTDPGKALSQMLELHNDPLCITLDLVTHLGTPRVLRTLRRVITHFEKYDRQLVLIDHSSELPDVIRTHATPFELALPTEDEVERIVRDVLRNAHRERPIKVDINRTTWRALLRNLHGLSHRQVERIIRDCIADDRRFDAEDLNRVLAEKRLAVCGGGLLQFVETPVSLNQIGGLGRLKQWLARREGALTDEARRFGLTPPRGVLMLGVQGAGKSLCAKAIATGWARPLLRLEVGALYDKYVGESERRLRDALRQAEAMAPIILWIDEIEKAFASAAAQSTDGGLSKRMFGTLLTWMQEHQAAVFVVATANDIEALPPELLRKGRFDEIFFVDLPVAETRAAIFAIHLRRRGRDPANFDLPRLVEASTGYSGAEIEQAVIAALHDAFAAGADVDTARLLTALEASPPLSVTRAEQVSALRAWSVGRCVPAE